MQLLQECALLQAASKELMRRCVNVWIRDVVFGVHHPFSIRYLTLQFVMDLEPFFLGGPVQAFIEARGESSILHCLVDGEV